MAERERKREEQPEGQKPERERTPGGGPWFPGGDAEPTNMPGEARERGLTPPPPEAMPQPEDEEERLLGPE